LEISFFQLTYFFKKRCATKVAFLDDEQSPFLGPKTIVIKVVVFEKKEL
jgi:hypothetical protein